MPKCIIHIIGKHGTVRAIITAGINFWKIGAGGKVYILNRSISNKIISAGSITPNMTQVKPVSCFMCCCATIDNHCQQQFL